MRPISVATFIAAIFVLGISLLWFPDICEIITDLMPVATPAWLNNGLALLPYVALSMFLLMLCWKVTRRGKPKFYEDE
jgi:membrane protein implicated in regulation of membrane protease activity